jgi:hypothetical protein
MRIAIWVVALAAMSSSAVAAENSVVPAKNFVELVNLGGPPCNSIGVRNTSPTLRISVNIRNDWTWQSLSGTNSGTETTTVFVAPGTTIPLKCASEHHDSPASADETRRY